MRKSAGRSASVDGAIAQLAEISDAAGRKQFLGRHRWLLQAHVVETLDEAVRERVRVNLDQALCLAEAALQIARKIGRGAALAHGLRAKANALHFLGQNNAAADLHEQAAALFESEGDAKELGRTLSGSILPLIHLGEYDRALPGQTSSSTAPNKCWKHIRSSRPLFRRACLLRKSPQTTGSFERYRRHRFVAP